VVVRQHSRKLPKMDILMSETCWAHKWNKIARDIKLVFHSSTIAMMHGPINIRYTEHVYLCAELQGNHTFSSWWSRKKFLSYTGVNNDTDSIKMCYLNYIKRIKERNRH
jgi:hypothetical protein